MDLAFDQGVGGFASSSLRSCGSAIRRSTKPGSVQAAIFIEHIVAKTGNNALQSRSSGATTSRAIRSVFDCPSLPSFARPFGKQPSCRMRFHRSNAHEQRCFSRSGFALPRCLGRHLKKALGPRPAVFSGLVWLSSIRRTANLLPSLQVGLDRESFPLILFQSQAVIHGQHKLRPAFSPALAPTMVTPRIRSLPGSVSTLTKP